jgi:hypothetical protein
VPVAIQAPAPIVAPYLGLVASVLCALGGGWLLLAPYVLDLRHGAAKLPRAAAVDLETGAAIAAVALLSAAFFAAALFSRLRPHIEFAEPEPEPVPEPELVSEAGSEPEPQSESDPAPGLTEPDTEPEADTEPDPDPDPQVAPEPFSSSSALREMLTPLVAALAADLRSPQQERGDQRRRQEP